MSDTDEVAQVAEDGNDTDISDADQAPIIDNGKEITKQDLSEVQHDDIRNKTDVTARPEGQIRIQVSRGQNEVKDHTDQNPDNSRQDDDECCINKVQPGSNTIGYNIIKIAGHQAHVQESSAVQGTGEVQSQVNCIEKDTTKSETGNIQIHAIDDVQDEAQSKVGQVDEQTSSDEQEGFHCDVSQVDDQTTNGEQEGFQYDVSQVDEQTTNDEQEGFQCDVSQVDEQEGIQCDVSQVDEHEGFQCDVGQADEQEGFQCDVSQVDEQEGFQCDVSQVDDQTTSIGHDEAESEVDNQSTSNEQEAAQDELGQNQTNSDENVEAMDVRSQVKSPTNGGRAVTVKTAVGRVKPKPTGRRTGKLTGKTGVLTGKKCPTSIGKRKRLTTKITRKIVKASGDQLQVKSASGQAQTKNALSQAKNVEKEELNVVAADEVQPELTDEKEPMNVENNASDMKETENNTADVLSKDQVQADTDLTWPSVSTQSPASGGLSESDGSHASKESKSVTMFWCDICKVVCTSALNLQMHFLGFKHKKIEAALKWNVNTEDEGTKDEFLAPTETRTVEDHLSKMKLNKAVLGLDYVVEYRNDQNTNPQFVCKLCYCKSELTWFLPHLLGAKHMANYLEKHHPYILKYEGEKLKPSEWKEFVFRKALEIEKTDGRGKVKVVFEKIDTKPNEKTAVKRVAEKPAAEPERKMQKTEAASSIVAAEPEHTVQNTEAAPSTVAVESEHTVQNTDAAPSTAQDVKENENWTGIYLYPDGLPITLPIEPKSQSQPVLAHQEAAAVATSAIDDQLSPIGSKLLENYIIQTDFEETIIGLDFLTEYHYVGKPEPLYYCELCTCELPLGCVLAHIFGLKHKMRYVKKRHPELLRLNAAKYKTIVKKKAAEIEKTDGRGRVRVFYNYEGPAFSERIAAAKIAAEEENKLQEMQEYSSYDQDQTTNMETYHSTDTRTKRSSASTNSKPSSRTSSSRGDSRSDSRYSRHDYSTSKRDQPRKRESSKDIKRSGEEWRDEWERSIKRAKSPRRDKKERERVKERSTRSDRDKDRRKSRSDSKDDYKRKERPRSSKEDRSKGSDTSVQAPAKPDPAKREAIIKREILKYLTSFKVINDTDAGYVKEVMYKLSNRLLQFGQKAMKITGSAEKLIEETKSCIPDGNPRRELRMARNLASYPGNSGRDACMRQSVEYPSSGTPFRSSSNNSASRAVMRNTDVTMSSIHSNILTPSLLNSIREMDENTVTNTLSRLAANNPAFEGIRISTLVTVLREAGVLSKRPS